MLELDKSNVRLRAQVANKEKAIREVGKLLVNGQYIKSGYIDSMMEREEVANTYLGNGISIPHGLPKDRDLILRTGISVLQVPEGVEWNPGEIVRLVVGIAARSDEHLELLANLTSVLGDEQTVRRLATTEDPDDIINSLTRKKEEKTAPGPAMEAKLAEFPNYVEVKVGGVHGLHASTGAYKHLMTGVSYMLPLVVAGGLMIAIAFALGGIYGYEQENTLGWALFQIGAPFGFALMVPVLACFIPYSIADRPGIAPVMIGGMQETSAVVLGLILGSMMVFDMGGPVNKAAYTFSVGLISSEVYTLMAAVMAVGMTPPLGLALATYLFKNRFTRDEQEAGKAAVFLGISFITEGAIPFAASDPFRVIPSIMVGSAVTGALSMLFGAQLRVPHGGIFVLPIPNAVVNLGMYIVAIVVGTLVTTGMLYFLKKPLIETTVKKATVPAAAD